MNNGVIISTDTNLRIEAVAHTVKEALLDTLFTFNHISNEDMIVCTDDKDFVNGLYREFNSKFDETDYENPSIIMDEIVITNKRKIIDFIECYSNYRYCEICGYFYTKAYFYDNQYTCVICSLKSNAFTNKEKIELISKYNTEKSKEEI